MYHCFGSVGGGIVMAVHGTTVVFPSTGYDGHANLVAIEKEKYVVIHVKFFLESESESEWALSPGMFTHTRNLFSWQKLPQRNRMTVTEQKTQIIKIIKKNK